MLPTRIALLLLPPGIAVLASTATVAAPAELYGKSIVVTWTEERVQRQSGQTEFRSTSRTGEFAVYVSTQGRVFNRSTIKNSAARRGRGREGSAERVGSEGNSRVSFAGRSLIAIQISEHGARRILVYVSIRRSQAVPPKSFAARKQARAR